MNRSKLSVVIVTYGRESVLIETIQHLLEISSPADEILIIDQTIDHELDTTNRLAQWHSDGCVRWIRRERPSITAAMNHGLRVASSPLVLFVDDDVVPISDIVAEHAQAHSDETQLWASMGQVIQPWQKPEPEKPNHRLRGLRKDFDFPFHSTLNSEVENVIACNLCVNRDRAISIGGFDEKFVGSAYRFETEFARRIGMAGGRIQFLGSAGLKHLRVPSGGTRKEGNHLASASPKHGIGDYYYAYLHGNGFQRWSYVMHRMIREVSTKFHLTHPWWIPVKLIGELRAMWQGWKLAKAKKAETNDRD
jgi:GT2 family glycosyltransferase